MLFRFIALITIVMGYFLIALPAFSCTKGDGKIAVGSFNVKWVGYYEAERDNEGLASLMKNCDVVVIQELVAPPDVTRIGKPVNWPTDRGVRYPNGKKLKFDKGATDFFEAMVAAGFDRFVLSEEDTGPGDKNHKNSASTEWFVAFYKSARLISPWDEGGSAMKRGGYLACDLTANADYERVPFAFPFKTRKGLDFVLISVHLKPDGGKGPRARRAEELTAIAGYIERNSRGAGGEKDWFILGDMNIQSCKELEEIIPAKFVSLNDECRDTVPSKADRPYDHVMYRPDLTNIADMRYDMVVQDIVSAVRHRWSVVGNGPYPGEPYKSRIFPKYFSDHNPVDFQINDGPDQD